MLPWCLWLILRRLFRGQPHIENGTNVLLMPIYINTVYAITHISQFKGSGLRAQKLATLVWRKIKALFVLALRPSISYPNFTFRTTDPRSRPGVNFRDMILYQKGHGIELETLPGCICSVCCLGNRLLLFGINLLFRLTFGGLTLVLN